MQGPEPAVQIRVAIQEADDVLELEDEQEEAEARGAGDPARYLSPGWGSASEEEQSRGHSENRFLARDGSPLQPLHLPKLPSRLLGLTDWALRVWELGLLWDPKGSPAWAIGRRLFPPACSFKDPCKSPARWSPPRLAHLPVRVPLHCCHCPVTPKGLDESLGVVTGQE
ncbi:La-related protein 6 [Galemys pyrenaicus]|uniref:La-related protein 6 n=1 Tax=Galemys pyrenaicus TaxID=202257 RepID=A0A8J5ZTB5_GALPY|nr:La-related protein 6 [Galemys pyrenaicus]